MATTFIALCDPVQHLLRSLTRHVPLSLAPATDGALTLQYRVQPEDLPDSYFSLAVFHALNGCPLEALAAASRLAAPGTALRAGVPARVNFFDALKLDRRCARDVRLRSGEPAAMLSGELLAFGAGTLRSRDRAALKPAQRQFLPPYGRLQSPREVVYARIRVLSWDSLPLFYQGQKESFDSTNVVYGDVLGEVEQLWARRADTVFLEQAARTLQRLDRRRDIATGPQRPLNLKAAVEIHLGAQALWKTPPASARALLRRLEYVLEHTTVETSPATVFEAPATPRPKSRERARSTRPWTLDRSGFDGWLEGT